MDRVRKRNSHRETEKERQTDRQTDTQKHTQRQRVREKEKERETESERWTEERNSERWTEREIDRQQVIKTINQLQNAREIRRRSVDVKYHMFQNSAQFKNVHAKNNTTAKLTPLIPAPAC